MFVVLSSQRPFSLRLERGLRKGFVRPHSSIREDCLLQELCGAVGKMLRFHSLYSLDLGLHLQLSLQLLGWGGEGWWGRHGFAIFRGSRGHHWGYAIYSVFLPFRRPCGVAPSPPTRAS